MTKEDLKEILEKHKKWVDGEPGGERANLRGADLQLVLFRKQGVLRHIKKLFLALMTDKKLF